MRTFGRPGRVGYHPLPVAKKSRTPAPPRRVQAPQRRDTRRPNARVQQQRALAARGRMFWGFVIGAAVVLVVVGVALGVVLSQSGTSSGSSSYTTNVSFAQLPNLHQGAPPWDSG